MTGDTENPIFATIDAAEDVADPLDGLVERVATDAGAPFAPQVLVRLCELKREDRRAFEVLRVQLKKAGCRVTALDDAIAEENGDTGRRGPSEADILIGLAADAELFHTPNSTGYADIQINGHRETWPIRNKGFKRWLARRFFEAVHGAPNSEALPSALGLIEARAHFDGPQMDVNIRVAGHAGKIYLDLADAAWRAVEIDADGWRIVEAPPVRFRRAAGMQPLPEPATADRSRRCGHFSMSAMTLISSWWLLGRWPYCATRGRTRCSCCRASRAPRNRPSLQSCGHCSTPTVRRSGPCRARTATSSLPRPTATC